MAVHSFFMLFDRNGKPMLPGTGAFRRPDWIELIRQELDLGQQPTSNPHKIMFHLVFRDGEHVPILYRMVAAGHHAASGTLMTLRDDGGAYLRHVLFDPLPASLQGSRDDDPVRGNTFSLAMEMRRFSITYRSPDGAVSQKTVRASE